MRNNYFEKATSILMIIAIIIASSLLSSINTYAADTTTKTTSASVCGYTVKLSANFVSRTFQRAPYVKLKKVSLNVKKIKGKKQGTIKKIVITYSQSGGCIKKNSKGEWYKTSVSRRPSTYTVKNPKEYSKSISPSYPEYVSDSDLGVCGAKVDITYKDGDKTKTKTKVINY